MPSGSITMNLRLPGQYYDAEAGLHYNYFRDYEANTGRYIESDPLALKGGISTYSYVFGDPLTLIDLAGLVVEVRCRTIGSPHNPSLRSRFAAALGGEHCFIHVSCPEAGIDETISYLGPIFIVPAGGPPNNDTTYSDEGRYRSLPVTPPQDNCPQCKFEKCVDTTAKALQSNGYRIENYSALFGPNSNSFTRRLVEKCGGHVGGQGPETGWNSQDQTGF